MRPVRRQETEACHGTRRRWRRRENRASSGRIGLVALAALAVLVLLPVAPEQREDLGRQGRRVRSRRRHERLGGLRLRQARLGLQADHRPLLPQGPGREGQGQDRVRVLLGLALRRRQVRRRQEGMRSEAEAVARPTGPSAGAQGAARIGCRQAARELRQAPPRQGRRHRRHPRRRQVPGGARSGARRRRGLLVVNRLDVEDYVRGSLPGEIPADWPKQTLKAFADRDPLDRPLHRRRRQGIESHSDTRTQVYGGVKLESKRTNRAARGTRHRWSPTTAR